jgi:hypothetical protein
MQSQIGRVRVYLQFCLISMARLSIGTQDDIIGKAGAA